MGRVGTAGLRQPRCRRPLTGSLAKLPEKPGDLDHLAAARGAGADERAPIPMARLEVRHVTPEQVVQAHAPLPLCSRRRAKAGRSRRLYSRTWMGSFGSRTAPCAAGGVAPPGQNVREAIRLAADLSSRRCRRSARAVQLTALCSNRSRPLTVSISPAATRSAAALCRHHSGVAPGALRVLRCGGGGLSSGAASSPGATQAPPSFTQSSVAGVTGVWCAPRSALRRPVSAPAPAGSRLRNMLSAPPKGLC